MNLQQFRNELEDLKNEFDETAYLLKRGAETTASFSHSEDLMDEHYSFLVELDEINYYLNKDLNFEVIEEMDENVYHKETKDLIRKYMIEHNQAAAA